MHSPSKEFKVEEIFNCLKRILCKEKEGEEE